MALEISEGGPQLSPNDIERVERQFGFPLPVAYRSFLLMHNGGRPSLEFFPIEGLENNEFGTIQVFFGIGSIIETSDLVWRYKAMKGRLPTGQFAIACTGMGDLLCLTLRGLGAGRVMFWDHNSETDPPTFDNMYNVAQSFEAFLASLHFRDLSKEIAELLVGARVLKKPN